MNPNIFVEYAKFARRIMERIISNLQNFIYVKGVITMYEDEMMNNEVMETETTEMEVSNNEDYVPAAASVPAEIIVPQTDSDSDGKGPNKLLIAAAVAGGLFIANKAKKKLKPAIEARKAKKAKQKEEEIMAVLVKAGVVAPPAQETKPADAPAEVVDVKPEDIKEATEQETKTEEKKEDKDKK